MALKFIIILFAILFSFPFIVGTTPERRSSGTSLLKPLPVDVDSFAALMQGGYIYVDKTDIVLKVIKEGRKFIYLARPKGFGKSLLLSTIYEIFRGHKELFKDTKIYESDYQWTAYPVVKIDFSKLNCGSPTQLKNSLMKSLREVAKSYGISVLRSTDVADRVKSLIEGLRGKFSKKVVFLIDEYDHAYLENFNPQKKFDEVHAILSGFYSSLHNRSEEIEFCFTTYVNYISQIIRWDKDKDITKKVDFAHITGFTHEEVVTYFRDHLKAIAKHRNITIKYVVDEMRSWYYGYWFRSSEDLPREPTTLKPSGNVMFYNPYSILKYLQSKEAGIFWAESQSPTVNSLLQEFIEREPWQSLCYLQDWDQNFHWLWTPIDLKSYGRESDEALNMFTLERGYFVKTHQGLMYESIEYMDFANQEVKEIFGIHLTKVLGVEPPRLIEIAQAMGEKLMKVQIDEFIVNMNTFLSMLPPFPFPATTKMMRNNSTDTSKIRMEMFRLNFHGALIVTRLFNKKEYFAGEVRNNPLRGYAVDCPEYVFYLRTSEENAVKECSRGHNIPPTGGTVCLDITFDAKSRQIIQWNGRAIGSAELETKVREQQRINDLLNV